ncbi:hypothetical protein GMAR_ORF87 [Golden Marseillevirus]|uniref:hypothetical protein n=1 Tax=Golden Marseillevirus TaxID=1720526 RepID=UPI000877AA08|nr:hypothetical protein GMAR_ORF87 [Golden Marseillevirus]ALX27462.1 hypothetical protein GMAR_ORF87 [Golden Marseillevirus]
MDHTKLICLNATDFKGRWYFNVSEEKEPNTVCTMRFPVLVPRSAVLVPESSLFGNLQDAINTFVGSAYRQSSIFVDQNVRELKRQILVLQDIIDGMKDPEKEEERTVLCHLLDEKVCEEDELTQSDSVKKQRQAKETSPGLFGKLETEIDVEEDEDVDE